MSNAIGISLPRLSRSRSGDRQTQKYAVNGKVPGFTADFIDNYYFGHTSLSSAITHARAGNATMTDGYGPELVVNGGFTGNADNWTLVNSTYRDNAVDVATTSAVFPLAQTGTTAVSGKSYVVTFQIRDYQGSGAIKSSFGGVDGTFRSANGYHTEVITTTGTGYLLFKTGGTAFTGSIDNVSVREMPVIKWAPHNLLKYSEDFTNAVWVKTADTSIVSSAIQAPDGSFTATHVSQGDTAGALVQSKTAASGQTASIWARTVSGTGTIAIGGHNSYAKYQQTLTEEWQQISVETLAGETGDIYFFAVDFRYGTLTELYIWGAHIYRSDLGGMVDNPDQPPSRASYVPTTSSAVYLPRIGHHVYNGSAWVNEGLLAESESRTNLVDYSNPDNSWTIGATTLTLNDAVSPDGTENATKITESATASAHYTHSALTTSFTSGSTYTLSAYLKAGTKSIVQLTGTSSAFGSTLYGNFDLANGVVGSVASGVVSTIQDVGNGWYRCSVSGDATATATGNGLIIALIDDLTDTRIPSYTGSTSNDLYAYGTQTEEASTPSSLIPTSGSSVSRAAETFTIPSANLPWPTPQYIGDELVTNGTFDTDSDWTDGSSGTGTVVIANGVATATGVDSSNRAILHQGFTTVVGKVYECVFDLDETVSGNSYPRIGTSANGEQIYTFPNPTTGTHKKVFVATTTTTYFSINVTSGTFEYDNISVREINPLSVSIAMDGRMTYADTGGTNEAMPYQWRLDGNNILMTQIRGNGDNFYFQQAESGVFDNIIISNYGGVPPDINTPFDIAARHGSTFVNGAINGVEATANTTPTALADLSSTDLELAYNFQGTIGTFRVWDKDLGDAGIVEATNPSLEPSLSLTFEGTGTNSFVVNNWSE